MLLAKTYDPNVHDASGYLMSTKLDGVRAYYNGKNLYSRNGNLFNAPDWFLRDLPSFPLDGELYMGVQTFNTCVSIVRKKVPTSDWKRIKYCVFDAPAMKKPFKDRYEALLEWEKKKKPKYAYVLNHTPCQGKAHLEQEMDKVIAQKGEGMMLREPNSLYEKKRSITLLKVKRFLELECKVIGKENGQGRLSNTMGKLVVELPSKVQFRVGSGFSDKERHKPPKIGSIITVKYQELSAKQRPRFPIYLRERPDLTWEDVVKNSKQPDVDLKQATLPASGSSASSAGSSTGSSKSKDSVSPSRSPSASPKPIVTQRAPKLACKYGKSCYRKNPVHLNKYTHL